MIGKDWRNRFLEAIPFFFGSFRCQPWPRTWIPLPSLAFMLPISVRCRHSPRLVSFHRFQEFSSNHFLSLSLSLFLPQDEKYGLSMQRYKGQQYSQLYFVRILTIRQFLTPCVQQRWPSLPGLFLLTVNLQSAIN